MTLPNYNLSYFKIPKKFGKEINSLMAKFQWGDTGEKRKIHWLNWERMTRSKVEGGMKLKIYVFQQSFNALANLKNLYKS